eukprot:jgi/Picre1/30151/NNA_005520.t1
MKHREACAEKIRIQMTSFPGWVWRRICERAGEAGEGFGVITDGLESLEKLDSLADTMERLAHEIFDRKRMEKETQDDIVDDSLYAAMVNHALVMSLSKEHVQNVKVYYEELARHIGKVILEFTRSSWSYFVARSVSIV